MTEQWKCIPDFPDYAVSSFGRVKRLTASHKNPAGYILCTRADRGGYLRVQPFKNGKRKQVAVSRLVAQAFIPNPLNLPEVNHKKGKQKWNNRVSNLEWTTGKGNVHHAWKHKLAKPVRGSKHGNAVITSLDALKVKQLLAKGWKHLRIAASTGVSKDIVENISQGRAWKHVQ